MSGEKLCHCGNKARARGKHCSERCRKRAYDIRELKKHRAPNDQPARFAIADPVYVKRTAHYRREPDSPGTEVDHAALVQRLEAGGYAGYAIAAGSHLESLATLAPLLPAGRTLVASWYKPHAVPAATLGAHNVWEVVFVVGGRRMRPGFPNVLKPEDCPELELTGECVLRALPARGGGTLIGRKPIAWCAWVFDLLGMLPGDTLDDIYSGTGAVQRAWNALSPRTSTTPGGAAGLAELVRQRILPTLPRSGERERQERMAALEQLSLLESPSPLEQPSLAYHRQGATP